MRRLPDSILFVIVFGVGTLSLAVHSIYEDLLKSVLLRFFGRWLDLTEAELASRIAELAIPLLIAFGALWFLWSYFGRQTEKGIAEATAPRVCFEDEIDAETITDAKDRLIVERVYLRVKNPGASILERCLVKIERIETDGTELEEVQTALSTAARASDGFVGRFALSGDESKRVILTERDAKSSSGQYEPAIKTERGDYILPNPTALKLHLVTVSEQGQAQRRILNLVVDQSKKVKATWNA